MFSALAPNVTPHSETNNVDECLNEKEKPTLSLPSPSLPRCWAVEWESPLAVWQQREVAFCVVFVWQTHSVINSFTNIPRRIETQTTEVLLGRNKTWKGCVKSPWGDDGWGRVLVVVGGGGGVLRCECQISQPWTKAGFKSFAHSVWDKNKVYCVWSAALPSQLGYDHNELSCNCVNQTN